MGCPIRVGLALRAIGLAVVPFVDSPSSAYLAALLLGIGVALHEPAVYGALGTADTHKRDRASSLGTCRP